MGSIPTEAPTMRAGPPHRDILPLENGDHLGATDFLRRYEAMAEVKKAELVNGIVYMGFPVRLDRHGEPDGLLQTWLGAYAAETPGVKHAVNSTARLSPDDVLQPDALLRIVPECGGPSRPDPQGYLQGPPELVAEIAASSASIDVREKLASYRRAGVREYLVWRTEDETIDWWFLEEDQYRPLPPDAGGILRSKVLPGLWLDPAALLARNGANVLATLRTGLNSAEHTAFVSVLAKRSE